MTDMTILCASEYVGKWPAKINPLVAAKELAEIWQIEPTTHIDVWGCDWLTNEFFEYFLDHCRLNGCLKEALKIWWSVHNCPGPETEPCYHNYVCQQIIDYSIKYGMESETNHLKEHGLDAFKFIIETQESYRGKGLLCCTRLAYEYPNPKDENGRFIPLIKDKNGNVIHWPRHDVDDRFLTYEEIDELGI